MSWGPLWSVHVRSIELDPTVAEFEWFSPASTWQRRDKDMISRSVEKVGCSPSQELDIRDHQGSSGQQHATTQFTVSTAGGTVPICTPYALYMRSLESCGLLWVHMDSLMYQRGAPPVPPMLHTFL